jgi:hypothetical protein
MGARVRVDHHRRARFFIDDRTEVESILGRGRVPEWRCCASRAGSEACTVVSGMVPGMLVVFRHPVESDMMGVPARCERDGLGPAKAVR